MERVRRGGGRGIGNVIMGVRNNLHTLFPWKEKEEEARLAPRCQTEGEREKMAMEKAIEREKMFRKRARV